MAGAVGRKVPQVLLGYPDEKITEKYLPEVDFTTSKIGGFPDWICGQPSDLNCSICNSGLKLVVQIYAPIENSLYHRTLYIFGCIQPTCWNKTESWRCYRGQKLEPSSNTTTSRQKSPDRNVVKSSDWLDDADDWGSDNDVSADDPNGNFESNFDQLSLDKKSPTIMCRQMSSSSSGEMSTSSIHDPNANQQPLSPESSGAAGGIDYTGLVATAEIEAETDQELLDLVAAESPTPMSEILSEKGSNIAELLFSSHNNSSTTTSSGKCLTPLFLSVEEEDFHDQGNMVLTEHERQLLQEYSLKEKLPEERGPQGGGGSSNTDVYEKAMPRHGDLWFHKFLTVMQKNPGQVIRYSRDMDNTPLFLSKPEVGKIPPRCPTCQGPLLCEVQLLPSLIPSLKFEGGVASETPIEFGSVMVYTCVKSCWQDKGVNTNGSSYINELIYLQAETL